MTLMLSIFEKSASPFHSRAPLAARYTAKYPILISSGHSRAIWSAGSAGSSSWHWGMRRVLDRWDSKHNAVYYCLLLYYDVMGVMGDRHGHLGWLHVSDSCLLQIFCGAHSGNVCVLFDYCPPLIAVWHGDTLPSFGSPLSHKRPCRLRLVRRWYSQDVLLDHKALICAALANVRVLHDQPRHAQN